MHPPGLPSRRESIFAISVFVALMPGIVAVPVKAQIPPDTVIEVAELEVVVGSRAGVADPARPTGAAQAIHPAASPPPTTRTTAV